MSPKFPGPTMFRILFSLSTAVFAVGCRMDGTPLWKPGATPSTDSTDASSIPPGYPVPWLTDFDAASALAESQNKWLLVLFTGSDWCAWCQRLKDEILSSETFKQWVGDRMICVELDFPRHQPQRPDIAARNQEVLDDYASYVTSFPTLLVLDTNGAVVGRLGYWQGGADAWVARAEQVVQTGAHYGPSVFSGWGTRPKDREAVKATR